MATNEEKYETFKRMDMPLLANHHKKLMDRENRASGRSSGPTAVAGSGRGGKGARPDINPNTNEGSEALAMAQQQFNNDGSYGYYNNQGRYVPFSVDIRDGGGMNTSGNFFKGAGPLSTALNVAKVRPAGPAREMRDGNYVIPREQIGFRDITDATDRGGPQASGGRYEGGGMVSSMFNLADDIGRATIPERQEYIYNDQGVFQPRTDFTPMKRATPDNRKMSIFRKILMGG